MSKTVVAFLTGAVLFALIAGTAFGTPQTEKAPAFPSKPIHLVVYTAPGGLIDITSRKMVEIAAKYTDATFVVENKAGAGGMVGWESVLAQPADGYTLMAVTKALIANLVSTEAKIDPLSLEWIAYLINDTECLITSTKGKVRTYVQFERTLPAGFDRLGLWPVELFDSIAPPKVGNGETTAAK